MRISPFSYLDTAIPVRPSLRPRSVWLIFIIRRRMRMRFPTCRSVGFGCFLALIFLLFFLLSSRDVYGGSEGSAMYRACSSFDPSPSVGLSPSRRKNLKSGIPPDARLEFGLAINWAPTHMLLKDSKGSCPLQLKLTTACVEPDFWTRRLLTRLFDTIGGPGTSGNGSYVGFCGRPVIIGPSPTITPTPTAGGCSTMVHRLVVGS
jgi:hypothetical protein